MDDSTTGLDASSRLLHDVLCGCCSALRLEAERNDNERTENRDEYWNQCAPQLAFRGKEENCNVDGAHQTDQDGHSSRTCGIGSICTEIHPQNVLNIIATLYRRAIPQTTPVSFTSKSFMRRPVDGEAHFHFFFPVALFPVRRAVSVAIVPSGARCRSEVGPIPNARSRKPVSQITVQNPNYRSISISVSRFRLLPPFLASSR